MVLSLWHNWPYVASSLEAHFLSIWRESSDWESCFWFFSTSSISLLVRERMEARDGHSDLTTPASNSRNCSSGLRLCFSGSSRVPCSCMETPGSGVKAYMDRTSAMKIAVGHPPKSDQIPSVAALFLPVTVT